MVSFQVVPKQKVGEQGGSFTCPAGPKIDWICVDFFEIVGGLIITKFIDGHSETPETKRESKSLLLSPESGLSGENVSEFFESRLVSILIRVVRARKLLAFDKCELSLVLLENVSLDPEVELVLFLQGLFFS